MPPHPDHPLTRSPAATGTTAADPQQRPAVTRRRLLGAAAALGTALVPVTGGLAAAQPTGAGGVRAGGGKGVSVTPFDGASAAIPGVGASWYYTWASTTGGTARPDGVEFVPMIWGAGSVTAAELDNARREGTQLLGFNEPDMAGQANMPPSQALDLWPQLQNTGLRLGAPAVAWGADQPGTWFDQFMSGVAARGLRVDFVPLHWYGGDFSAAAVDQLRGYLDAVHARWGRPVWLTEYALIDFSGATPRYPSEAEQTAFVRSVVPMLNSLPYLERHAWFTLSTGASPTGLWSGSGPNATGEAYRDAG